jgi:hypothetical protein
MKNLMDMAKAIETNSQRVGSPIPASALTPSQAGVQVAEQPAPVVQKFAQFPELDDREMDRILIGNLRHEIRQMRDRIIQLGIMYLTP